MPDPNAAAIPLLVSTRNAHKVAEIRAILGTRFNVVDLAAVPDMPDVEETGSTFEENAALKALAASERFDGWVIADDSGLEVDALGGAPGVFSARYAGLPTDDLANNALLLSRLDKVPDSSRGGRFRCVIVLARSGESSERSAAPWRAASSEHPQAKEVLDTIRFLFPRVSSKRLPSSVPISKTG